MKGLILVQDTLRASSQDKGYLFTPEGQKKKFTKKGNRIRGKEQGRLWGAVSLSFLHSQAPITESIRMPTGLWNGGSCSKMDAH